MGWLADIPGKVACALGSHRGKHIIGTFHKYYVCHRCRLRYVVRSKEKGANLVKVNKVWLDGGPFKPAVKMKGEMRNVGKR